MVETTSATRIGICLGRGGLWTLVSTRGSDKTRPNRNGAYDPPQMGYGASWQSPARWFAVFGDARRGMAEQMLGTGRLRRWGCDEPLIHLSGFMAVASRIDGLVTNRHARKFRCADGGSACHLLIFQFT